MTHSTQDSAAERWSRLYVDVRASYGRAAIEAALLLNGGASVALLAFLGNLAIAHQTTGLTGNFHALKYAFLCFGVGVMLAAISSVVAFLIQNVAIAHPKQAEGRTGRRLRWVGIGMVVVSLVFFAVGIDSNSRFSLSSSWSVSTAKMVSSDKCLSDSTSAASAKRHFPLLGIARCGGSDDGSRSSPFVTQARLKYITKSIIYNDNALDKVDNSRPGSRIPQ